MVKHSPKILTSEEKASSSMKGVIETCIAGLSSSHSVTVDELVAPDDWLSLTVYLLAHCYRCRSEMVSTGGSGVFGRSVSPSSPLISRSTCSRSLLSSACSS